MAALSRAEQDEIREWFVAGQQERLERFAERARRAGVHAQGVGDLEQVSEWFRRTIGGPPEVLGCELPRWLDPASHVRGEPGAGFELPLTRAQVAFVDDTQAFYASILQQPARPRDGSRTDRARRTTSIAGGRSWRSIGRQPPPTRSARYSSTPCAQ